MAQFYEHIPFDLDNIDTQDSRVSIDLGDTTINLVLRKPPIGDFYYIDVYDIANEPIVTGSRLERQSSILRGSKDDRFPEGITIAPFPINDEGL